MNLTPPEPSPQLIVVSPAEPIVESPTIQQVVTSHQCPPFLRKQKPNPILNEPPNESIANRMKARRRNLVILPEQSMADRVKSRHRTTEAVKNVSKGTYELVFLVLDTETGKLLEYRQLHRDPKFKDTWERSAANDFGMLAQGVGNRVKGTDIIYFIHKHEVPTDRFKDITYLKFVCNRCPEKTDPNCTRATFGGKDINYPHDCGTPTADLLPIKIFFNSVISTAGARFANADLSNFYYNHELKRPEFARVKLSDIPAEIINEYKLNEKVTADGWIYIKCVKTVPGLPQSGSLSHDALEARLNKEGYYKSKIVPALWKHKTRSIQFVLVVDDFGIKYTKKEDLDHLLNTLRAYYVK
jgi:hypothetical protein